MANKKAKIVKGQDHLEEDKEGEAQMETDTRESEMAEGTITSTETQKTRRSGGVRSVCAMYKVIVKKQKGKKLRVSYNNYGVPNGSTRHTLQSYVGFLARSMVPIDIESWPKVEKTAKDNIWAEIKATFRISEESRALILKSAGVKWRQFKAYLTTQHVLPFIGHKKKLRKPPKQYNFACRETWKKFVSQRTSPKWVALHQKQSQRVGNRKYPHRLSRKGYIGLEEEEAKSGKWEKGEVPDRAILWKKARMPKKSTEIDPDLLLVQERIDTLLEQKSKGEFKAEGAEDVLTAALETPEHSGRVRGVGGYVNPTTYFHMPKGNRVRITKAELMARDRQRTEEVQRDNESLRKEIAEMKVILTSIQAGTGIVPSPRFSEKASNHDKKVMNSASATVKKLDVCDDEVQVVDILTSLADKKDWRSCELALDNKDNKVAFGMVFDETEQDSLVNGLPLKPGYVRVWIDGVIQPDALLPDAVGKFTKVSQAVGSYVAWPADMIICTTSVIVQEKKKNSQKLDKGELVKMTKLYKETKLNKNVPERFRLLYKNATTFMKASGASIQIPCNIQVFGVHKTIFVLHENIIALCHFDMIGQAAISAYMAYLHTLVCTDTELADTFAFVDAGATYTLNKEFESYIVRRLKEGDPERMFFVPHNENSHWILSIIWEGEIYILNPLPGSHPFTAWEKALIGAIKSYNAETGRGNKLPRVKHLQGCPKQPGGSECGYVVMRYMREIIKEKELSIATKWSLKTRKTYTMDELDEVRYEALGFIERFM